MGSEKKLAKTVSGKTARACDNCISKRARWYCASDDAFLCQACDASVHSVNPLARRHERVRLKTSSIKITSIDEASVPSWDHGFTRKARTPRFRKNTKSKSDQKQSRNPLHLVPELCSDETSHEENEEQLLYRVPIFDPFAAERSTSANSNEAAQETIDESKASLHNFSHEINHFHGSLQSEMDLEEFAADVETLLGKGLEDETLDIAGLGLMDCKEKDYLMELNFDDNSLVTTCDEYGKVQDGDIIAKASEDCEEINGVKKKRKFLLRLDYDSVITAWDEQRSPWSTNNGERPELEFDECWPYCVGTCGTVHQFGNVGLMGHAPMVDVDREARVSRYREKRRTRLFSKKIRYEVRKLNAEKRPRIKGRFVKRANFAATGFPLLNK